MKRVCVPRRAWGVSAALALAVLFLAASGLLRPLDRIVEDALFQQPEALDGSIVVVGVTAEDLAELGPWPWDRSVMAQVLETLNADPDLRPAAIGLDMLYAGETTPAADHALAEAASAGNVAAACSAEFSSRLMLAANGEAYMEDFSISSLVLPFDALANGTRVGHINAMYDADGVLRHHLWSLPDGGGEILSLPYRMYELYCGYWGLEADFSPSRDSRGFWYVDYTGLPGAYFEYSVSDLLRGDYDPEALAGAAVLIGPYDMGLSDDFITSIDRAERMYGVEYLANVLSAMLRGECPREAADPPQLALLALGVFFLCLCFFTVKPGWGALLCLAVCAGYPALTLLAYAGGLLLHPLGLPVGAAAGFAAALGDHYRTVQREKRHIRSVFQRYVDPGILQELLREGPAQLHLAGKSTDIAVLFVDLRGFTSLSETLEPEQVVAILNDYLTLTSRCIRENGGTLDKFIGDCTMAFWGAPLPCPDPVYAACRAALEMVRGAEGLRRSILEKYGRTVSFGVGVHYGPAVVGNIGSAQRMDYTAIGDTVNTASRLEANAPAGTIYISRAVADALGSRAAVTALGGLRLKGKAEDFEVLTLDALTDGAPDTKGGSPDSPPED